MKKNSFVEGAVIATTAVIITKILGMLYVIPFYDIIGTQGGALYSYAYNIYSIFLGISSCGIPVAISKIISEYSTLGYEEAKYRTFKIGKKIIGILSVIGFFIMFIFADVMARAIIGNMSGGNSSSAIAFVIRCVSFAVLVIPSLSVTKGYIQGHSIVSPSSIGNIIEQIVRIFVILAGSFLAYKVFSLSLTLSVGIAVGGAFFGGIAAIIYLKYIMNKNKNILGIKEYEKQDNISNQEIIKKILTFSVPFIIINIATNIYNFTDMVLIMRGLDILNFSTESAEFIQSAITTWSTKISMIISSFAMGMSVSLIPNIVSSSVQNDWSGVNAKMNKAYQIILVISIPCAIGLCILARPVWNIFYGASNLGTLVLSMSVICAIFANMYSITFNTMQSLNKYKTVYLSILIGFGTNALLDIPLMLLFNKIGIPAYWGASVATIIGYIISMKIATHDLKKNHHMSFKKTYKIASMIMIPTLIMATILLGLNNIIRIDVTTKLNSIIMIIINCVVGGITYVLIAYKMGLFEYIFGQAYINKIIKKLTPFKK